MTVDPSRAATPSAPEPTHQSRVRVSGLTIRNFRNIAALDVELPDTGVVIIGDNGHGKTNFLEALYYLVLFRSLRGAKDRELVRFGEAGFFVRGEADARVTAGYEVAGRRKKVTVDSAPVDKLGDAVGRITAVPFAPADRNLVAGGPAGRRRYLDVLLSLSAHGYLSALIDMRSALKQRNAALRRGHRESARAFDAPFAGAAEQVARRRLAWTTRFADRYADLCRELGEHSEPRMTYHATWPAEGGAAELDRMLGASWERDLRRGMTTVGPHRDDIRLELDNRELRTYGSAGQQRTAAIALRLLEAETLAEMTGRIPIALFDDVFVELDETRQTRLLELIQHRLAGQMIITAPRDSEVPTALFDRTRWTMQRGRIV